MTPDDLKAHYLALEEAMKREARGTRLWFDMERAMFATGRLYGTMTGEAVRPVHSQPPYRGL